MVLKNLYVQHYFLILLHVLVSIIVLNRYVVSADFEPETVDQQTLNIVKASKINRFRLGRIGRANEKFIKYIWENG